MDKNKYGYKVCYKELGKHKLKIHIITNDYDLAKFEVQYCETHQQYDRKTSRIIKQATWHIVPIKNYFEFKWLWRGCPF